MQSAFKKEDGVVIYVDHRESSRIKPILRKKCIIREKQLHVADYLLSENVAAERKTTDDFLSSLINGRLFKQLSELRENFSSPVLIIEGNNIMDNSRKIHPNAIRGALASIATDYSIPMICTSSQKETAELLYTIAKREQLDLKKSIAIRGKKKMKSENQEQEFIVAGFPGISTVTAKKLLGHFGTLEKVFISSESELMKVDGIGKELAEKIRKILARKYEKSILD